jgi:hypothetical protein
MLSDLMTKEKRTVVGLTEKVKILSNGKSKQIVARIDTGATMSSIDTNLASELKVGPVVASKMVKSANGAKLRPMVEMTVNLEGHEVTARFTLADRSHMKYRVLIGTEYSEARFFD